MDSKKAIAQYELEKANNALKSAKLLYDAQDYYGSANRSYYAAFHAMSAMLANDGYQFKSHAGVIARFREYYIKTEELDKNLSPKIEALFNIRTNCDYKVFYVVAKSDVAEQISNANDIILAVENAIERKTIQTQKQSVESMEQQEPLRKVLAEQQAQGGCIPVPVQLSQELNTQEEKASGPTQAAAPKKDSQGFGGRGI